MNNKGFAITGIIYGLMLLFVVVVTSFLSILIGRNKRIDALIEGAYSSVEYAAIDVEYDTSDNYFYVSGEKYIIDGASEEEATTDIYITSKRAKYTFTINEKDCTTYLPENVMVITNNIKNDETNASDLYYYELQGENVYDEDLTDFEPLVCINN